MQNRRAISIGAGWVIVAVFLSAGIACACSIFPGTVEVGSKFQVKVVDRGHPVKGLRMVLSTDSSTGEEHKVVTESFADADGIAHFSNLSAGSYWLAADHDGGVGDAVVVNVSPKGPVNKTFSIVWPSAAPVTVRSAAGIVRGPDYYSNPVQAQLSISLLEGIPGREIEKTQSDSKGRFSFNSDLPPGIYFMRINPSDLRGWSGEQIEGMIVIEVAREAKENALNLDLGWSSCGLEYSQRVILPELKRDKICGAITDSEGAVVAKAQVILLAGDEEAEILEQTQSGPNGEFVIPKHPDGNYQLLIKSAGFSPYLRLIHLQNAGTSGSCPQPIPVKLGVM
jgi:Carboxypeptidase regulatory-like domain